MKGRTMGDSQTILIVDDEAMNIKLLRAHVLAAGYHVLEATSGEESGESRPERTGSYLA